MPMVAAARVRNPAAKAIKSFSELRWRGAGGWVVGWHFLRNCRANFRGIWEGG